MTPLEDGRFAQPNLNKGPDFMLSHSAPWKCTLVTVDLHRTVVS